MDRAALFVSDVASLPFKLPRVLVLVHRRHLLRNVRCSNVGSSGQYIPDCTGFICNPFRIDLCPISRSFISGSLLLAWRLASQTVERSCAAGMDPILSVFSGSDVARRYLNDCKEHLQRGDPSSAMHCLLQAVCKKGGAAGASDAQQLRATFLQRLQTTADLNDLLSRLNLASEAPPCREADGMSAVPSTASSVSSFMHATSHPSFARVPSSAVAHVDTSSFLCPACGGVFARDRQEQHYSQWCPALRHTAPEDCELVSDSDSDMVT